DSIGEKVAAATVEEMEGLAVEVRNCLKHCEVSFHVRTNDPANAILEMSEQIVSDLIVIGSNCKNSLERLILGSVCQAVLNEARCPVLVAKMPNSLMAESSPVFKNVMVLIDNSLFSDAAVKWLTNFWWAPDSRFITVAVTEENTDLDE